MASLLESYECRICAEERPSQEFYHHHMKTYVEERCFKHILCFDSNDDMTAVCRPCIQRHILSEIDTFGPEAIFCIESGCNANWAEWVPGLLEDADADFKELYSQKTFHLYWNKASKWLCPKGCDCTGYVVEPAATPGFPQVYCTACEERYCALCKVAWHKDASCKRFREENPETMREFEEEQRTLEEMASAGAKRCPRCMLILVKQGGCDSMDCGGCGLQFFWPEAEAVVQNEEVEQ
ncbi:hypothetical protein BDV95DRAFT_602266 [Massariosphaeria phaeospora]|uniref:RBR-type E3 ubiquitin transferase n=1 Tax=Massariosphaeria phaeospora TaxID=100035 RepID=A0A7C8MLI2_9PLEO|nr:hypothetical protein BDV95DRAFT_602266 [Massariosphaeria phaeospora]